MDSPSPVKKYRIKEKVAARISRESQPQILNLEAYILFMVSLDVDLPLSAFSSSYFFSTSLSLTYSSKLIKILATAVEVDIL